MVWIKKKLNFPVLLFVGDIYLKLSLRSVLSPLVQDNTGFKSKSFELAKWTSAGPIQLMKLSIKVQ